MLDYVLDSWAGLGLLSHLNSSGLSFKGLIINLAYPDIEQRGVKAGKWAGPELKIGWVGQDQHDLAHLVLGFGTEF